MTALKESETHLDVYTQDKETVLQIDSLLKAKRPDSEHEGRVQSGKDDGYTRFYQAKNHKVDGVMGKYFKVPYGFKKRLLDNIQFDTVEELPKVDNSDVMDFLRGILPTLPFKPYKHQLNAFMALTKTKNALPIVATGGGKSLIAYLALRYFYKHSKKLILVVPTIGLTDQMFQDFKDYNAPEAFLNDIKLIGGENTDKTLNANIVISTWQSLKKVMKDVKKYDCILVDEAHQAKADVLQEILDQPVPFKLGMTGSMPIVKVDAMALEQSLGQPNRIINARQLMDINLLTDTIIMSIFLTHPRKQTRSGMKYQKEVQFIRESLPRQDFVKSFLQKLKGVTVALYNVTAHGEDTFESLTGVKLTNKLKSDFEMMKEHNVFFMSGSTKSSVREQIRLYLNTCKNAVVIGQFSVLSTGINIPRLKNLVFLSSTKSYTLVLQAIGRIMRLHEDKGDKVYVFDLVDMFTYAKDTYSYNHFTTREAYYQSEGHPILERNIVLGIDRNAPEPVKKTTNKGTLKANSLFD